MTLKQLNKVKLNARTDFRMYEGRLFDIKQGEDHESFGDVAIRFIDMHFIHEEIKDICQGYERVRTALTAVLAGEEYWKWPVNEDEVKPTIWEVCLMRISSDQNRYCLESMSEELQHYFSVQYERNNAMRMTFEKFFPNVQKGILVDGEFQPMTEAQEGQRNLAEDVNSIEISFSAEPFLERMAQAKRLCEEQVDPSLILALFPE